jgi:two-component system chemotaxis response regulator CheB
MSAPSHRVAVEDSPQKVLIVDDSAVARAMLASMLTASGQFEVAGRGPPASAARRSRAGGRVDFILLDIELPGDDGLTALPGLAAAAPGVKIIVVSSATAAGVQALAVGAADALTKPRAGELTASFARLLVDTLLRLKDVDLALPPPAGVAVVPLRLPQPAAPPRPGGDEFDVLAIGASTGGIHALGGMLRELPASYQVPILVTQHLPSSFMPYFAAQLSLLAGRPCDVASDRQRISPGRVIVAPGDAHMTCVSLPAGGAAVRLSREPSPSGCLPSVDPMFASAADVFGRRMLAVVLSGMGRDGTTGARHAHAVGASVVVQDRSTSVVWGMPGSIVRAEIADAVLAPDAIGRLAAAGRRP